MTVRSILDTKGHQILSVEPDAKLSAAIKILGERKIGAVLVMNQGRLGRHPVGARHRPGAGRARRQGARGAGQRGDDAQGRELPASPTPSPASWK